VLVAAHRSPLSSLGCGAERGTVPSARCAASPASCKTGRATEEVG
jgi:hypothetical protein